MQSSSINTDGVTDEYKRQRNLTGIGNLWSIILHPIKKKIPTNYLIQCIYSNELDKELIKDINKQFDFNINNNLERDIHLPKIKLFGISFSAWNGALLNILINNNNNIRYNPNETKYNTVLLIEINVDNIKIQLFMIMII